MPSPLARALACLALAALSLAALAEVSVPPLAARVTDLTGTLTQAQLQSLEGELRAFERAKGSQIAVLMLPTTQPEAIEQYSIRVAESWKIGRAKTDDGVIVVIAKDDQRLRIEVGRGLEGAIPDVIAKRIIREVMAPHFLANDFFGGIAEGTRAIMKLIEGEPLPQAAARRTPGSSFADYGSVLVLLLVLTVAGGTLLTRLFGRVPGSALAGAVTGGAAWLIAGALVAGIIAAILAFVFTLVAAGSGARLGHYGRGGFGGWSGGGWYGGGSIGGGDGGFSGGGGDFGGGGASGSWGSN